MFEELQEDQCDWLTEGEEAEGEGYLERQGLVSRGRESGFYSFVRI